MKTTGRSRKFLCGALAFLCLLVIQISYSFLAKASVSSPTNGIGESQPAIPLLPQKPQIAGTIQLVSVATDGTQANSDSDSPSISADGRYVAFRSYANNLVAGDSYYFHDIFVRDRQLGTTTRVSVGPGGLQANEISEAPSISADGRYVAFHSYASNLVVGDTNYSADVFVHDRLMGVTTRLSVNVNGVQGMGVSLYPSISADGRLIAFQSSASNLVPGDTNAKPDVFVRDWQANKTTRVSIANAGFTQGDGDSGYPSISADGRFVAFESAATNLVPGDTNGAKDLFVFDLQTDAIERISVTSAGIQANSACGMSPCRVSLSSNGQMVAFQNAATNLVTGDTNGWSDVFVRNRQASQTSRISVTSANIQSNNLSVNPSVSGDGRFVAFESIASNLAPGDSGYYYNIFVHDRQTGATARISTSILGKEGSGYSRKPALSSDRHWIAFYSGANNLVAGDTNNSNDVFVAELGELIPALTYIPIIKH